MSPRASQIAASAHGASGPSLGVSDESPLGRTIIVFGEDEDLFVLDPYLMTDPEATPTTGGGPMRFRELR
jgi:hypothetical protein